MRTTEEEADAMEDSLSRSMAAVRVRKALHQCIQERDEAHAKLEALREVVKDLENRIRVMGLTLYS